ncbi:MAG: cyclopropane-fatty-acyl-phospholipid synthase [Lentisphaeria bacterium]|jgi:cyclopropane-fatty-acyl-phospholipid synthase
MTTASINNEKIIKQVKSSWMDSIAKRIVCARLNKLQRGRLVIEDDGEIIAFGDDGPNPAIVAHIHVHHSSAYRSLVLDGDSGAGEAYMLGTWSTPDLLKVTRIFCMNINVLSKINSNRPWLNRLSAKFRHAVNANTLSGSKKNISAHYDLGNDFFELFLDSSMMYSAAIYQNKNATLEEASAHKLHVICKKLRLNADDHLLEIGTGWGGLAIHAAKHYGCRVTTTTISEQQYRYAKEAVKREGLEDTITLLLKDYRELEGKYSKLVSVEMIEAVGYEHYKSYFSKCSSLLQDDGLMCIQAITIADQRFEQAKTSVDFIQRYIFPGGCLPSNEVISRCVARYTDMQIVGIEDIGLDYAATLADWRHRFFKHLATVKAMGYDEVFCRMWEYYLCYCEGGFLERVISTVHTVMAKPDARQLQAFD